MTVLISIAFSLATLVSGPQSVAADTSAAPRAIDSRAWVKLAEEIQHYWVFCINGHTSVEMWDEDQMHARYGSDVCQLHVDTSESGAMEWMDKNFPSKTCSC